MPAAQSTGWWGGGVECLVLCAGMGGRSRGRCSICELSNNWARGLRIAKWCPSVVHSISRHCVIVFFLFFCFCSEPTTTECVDEATAP